MNHKLNVVLAVATILGGLAAIWFFWDKIRPLIFRQAKSGIKNVDNGPASLDSLANVEKLIPDLLAEMKADLAAHPLCREFILLRKDWIYNSRDVTLTYYFDDHPELANKIRILENLSLVRDIKYNDVPRYVISERLAGYLLRT
jgi:hypothetical protein